jgi:hypothetical protein
MVRDYLDWAAEQVGIARLIAYLLPLIAAVSLVGGVAAYVTKDDGDGGGNLAVAPTRVATQPAGLPTQPAVLPTQPPPPPGGTPPPAGTPRPPGSPPAGTPGPAGTQPAGTPRPPGSPPAGTPAPGGTPAPSGQTYTVVSGDTGFGIATKLNVPAAQQATWLAELARLNNKPNANSLSVGEVLRLPPIPGAAAPAAPAATPGAAAPPPGPPGR